MSVSYDSEKIRVVKSLYRAMTESDVDTAEKLLATDLEWWFHGPPKRHHMMQMLTGDASHDLFLFNPLHVAEVGEMVVAEGWGGETSYWVHVWTVTEGVITQFREYFNTAVVVCQVAEERRGPALWRGKPPGRSGRQLPEIILAV